jgi:hypothetical protein
MDWWLNSILWNKSTEGKGGKVLGCSPGGRGFPAWTEFAILALQE